MNNVEKAMELAGDVAQVFADICFLEDQGTPYAMGHEIQLLMAAKEESIQALRTHLEAMESDRVRMLEALKQVLSTHSAERKAEMSLLTATENYSDHAPETDAYIESATAASRAEHEANSAIAQSTGETS